MNDIRQMNGLQTIRNLDTKPYNLLQSERTMLPNQRLEGPSSDKLHDDAELRLLLNTQELNDIGVPYGSRN